MKAQRKTLKKKVVPKASVKSNGKTGKLSDEKQLGKQQEIDDQRKKANTEIKKQQREAPRYIRDPLHDIIKIENDVVLRLLDSIPMQRLRRIRQLGTASLVYPGAEHSRFTHSLGVFHLAGRMLDQIDEVEPYNKMVIKTAALLHDVGHGPFSHLFEQALAETGFSRDDRNHEEWTKSIISKDSDVSDILGKVNVVFRDDVRSVIDKTFHKANLFPIVTSQFDADRFDYMLRDSLMTGVAYGKFDLNWLLMNLYEKKKPPNGREEDGDTEEPVIAINIRRGLSSLNEYLLGNLDLYKHVYYHKTVQAADAMILSILRRIIDLLEAKEASEFGIRSDPLEKISKKQMLSNNEYMSLDDNVLLSWISTWAQGEYDPMLTRLSRNFLSRELFKTIDLGEKGIKGVNATNRVLDELNSVVGEDAKYLVKLIEPSRTAYKSVRAEQIYYIDEEGDSVAKMLSELLKDDRKHKISREIVANLKFESTFLVVAPKYVKDAENIIRSEKSR